MTVHRCLCMSCMPGVPLGSGTVGRDCVYGGRVQRGSHTPMSLQPVPPLASGQHSFALVYEVAGDVAQDEDDPEEGHSSQHLQGDTQPARAQLRGEPRVRTASM